MFFCMCNFCHSTRKPDDFSQQSGDFSQQSDDFSQQSDDFSQKWNFSYAGMFELWILFQRINFYVQLLIFPLKLVRVASTDVFLPKVNSQSIHFVFLCVSTGIHFLPVITWSIKVLLHRNSEYKSAVSWNIELQPWATRHECVAALISTDTILYDIPFFFFWLLWIGCSRCIDNSRSVFYVKIPIQVVVWYASPMAVSQHLYTNIIIYDKKDYVLQRNWMIYNVEYPECETYRQHHIFIFYTN